MDFQELNSFIQSAPEVAHWAVSCLLLGSYAQLALAYFASFNILPKGTRWYFPIAHLIMSIYFFSKLSSSEYTTMLDVFLPTYIIYYINMVIVLKARYFRCFNNVKGFFQYTWHAKTMKEEEISKK